MGATGRRLQRCRPACPPCRTEARPGGGNTDRGFGAAVSISGSRPDQNSYRLDGISINDYANGAPGSVLGDNLGIDAVEQVSVLGSNYPADYGRTSGGVINVVTRSGKDTFHGSVYEFLRNSALDARNFFDGPVIPPFKRNQFGGSGGLPIQKDRTFIFGDYEGLRQSLGVDHGQYGSFAGRSRDCAGWDDTFYPRRIVFDSTNTATAASERMYSNTTAAQRPRCGPKSGPDDAH